MNQITNSGIVDTLKVAMSQLDPGTNPGICTTCGTVYQDIEPDADDQYACERCNTLTVCGAKTIVDHIAMNQAPAIQSTCVVWERYTGEAPGPGNDLGQKARCYAQCRIAIAGHLLTFNSSGTENLTQRDLDTRLIEIESLEREKLNVVLSIVHKELPDVLQDHLAQAKLNSR